MNNKPGTALEEAVEIIRTSILESDPRFKGTRFTVERRRILNVNGARHEIDVFVQTLPGSDLAATFIYECKDWADPVGIEAVHVLANKMETLQATRGFLVARQLTKDARALLDANPKLRHIRCSSEFAGPLNTVTLCHSVHDPIARTVSLRFRGIPPSEHPTKLEWEGKTCSYNNQDTDLHAVIEPWFDELVAEDTRKNAAKYLHEGTHSSTLTGRVEFQPGEFLFDGMDVEHLDIQGHYHITVTRQKPRFKFELDQQGRIVAFDQIPDVIPGANLKIHLVQRF
jgi:hypothetical protein